MQSSLQKLMVSQLINSINFVKSVSSSRCSLFTSTATGSCLNQLHPMHSFTLPFFNIQFNVLPSTSWFPKWVFLLRFFGSSYAFLITPMHVICIAYLILVDFLALKYLAKSINCEVPHYVIFYSPVTPYLTPKKTPQNFVLSHFQCVVLFLLGHIPRSIPTQNK
jgi:hypothetical protein